jgi:hypothetical protein
MSNNSKKDETSSFANKPFAGKLDHVQPAAPTPMAAHPANAPSVKEAPMSNDKSQAPSVNKVQIGLSGILSKREKEAEDKKTEAIVLSALTRKMKPKLDPEHKLCSMGTGEAITKKDFVVDDGVVYPVGAKYARMAKAKFNSLPDKVKNSTDVRLVRVLDGAEATALRAKDMEHKQKFEDFADGCMKALDAMKAGKDPGVQLKEATFYVRNLNGKDATEDVRAYLASGDNDGLDPNGKITSIVIFNGVLADNGEKTLCGFFASAKTAAALHRRNVATVHALYRTGKSGEAEVTLLNLRESADRFFPAPKSQHTKR